MIVLGIRIATARTIDTEIEDRAKAIAELKAAALMRRYAENPDCLRSAVAAHCGLSSERIIRPDSMLLKPMTAAVRAFADRMAQVRGEAP